MYVGTFQRFKNYTEFVTCALWKALGHWWLRSRDLTYHAEGLGSIPSQCPNVSGRLSCSNIQIFGMAMLLKFLKDISSMREKAGKADRTY